jgi:hypothetical protein
VAMEKSLEPIILVSQAAQDSKRSGNEIAVTGLCCYSDAECDGKRDYCSKDEANCAECGGSFVVPGGSSKTTQAAKDSTGAFLAVQDSTEAFPPAWFAVASSWWLAIAGIAAACCGRAQPRVHGQRAHSRLGLSESPCSI